MRLGLTLAATHAPADAVQAAMAAERAGVETIYVVERHFDPDTGFANAFAVAAALSGRLHRALIGVQPEIGLDHPLRIVEQSNVLDVLTRGRCLIVLSDGADTRQYDAFGLPTPRNGLFEDLLRQMNDAWAWHFSEDQDSPPLEFQSGAFTTRMAGRIMPAPYRSPHPLLARETDSEDDVREAARRGWALHLRDATNVERLLALYRQELTSPALLDRITVSMEKPEPSQVRWLAECGVAEVRVNAFETALQVMRKL